MRTRRANRVTRRASRIVTGLAAVALGIGTAALAAPAQAAAPPEGTVVDYRGTIVRDSPMWLGPKVDRLANGETFTVGCKVRGGSINGFRIWYRIDDGTAASSWVSDRYVVVRGPRVHWCGPPEYPIATPRTIVNTRIAPSTDNARSGTREPGDQLGLLCKMRVQSTKTDHATTWYWLRDRSWVAARHVGEPSYEPGWCRNYWPY